MVRVVKSLSYREFSRAVVNCIQQTLPGIFVKFLLNFDAPKIIKISPIRGFHSLVINIKFSDMKVYQRSTKIEIGKVALHLSL